MTHTESPKFWVPKYQEAMSLEQLQYRKQQEAAAKQLRSQGNDGISSQSVG